MHTISEKSDAQMAESVDALVSNTSRFTPVPVRPRLWVHEERSESFSLFCWFWREPTFGRCVRCGMALYEQARQATPHPPQANAYTLAIMQSRSTHLNKRLPCIGVLRFNAPAQRRLATFANRSTPALGTEREERKFLSFFCLARADLWLLCALRYGSIRASSPSHTTTPTG